MSALAARHAHGVTNETRTANVPASHQAIHSKPWPTKRASSSNKTRRAGTTGALNSSAANRKAIPWNTFCTNIKEAIELYLDTLPTDERDAHLSREILTTTFEVKA